MNKKKRTLDRLSGVKRFLSPQKAAYSNFGAI